MIWCFGEMFDAPLSTERLEFIGGERSGVIADNCVEIPEMSKILF